MRCPGCDHDITIPDICSRTPPGTEIACACGDAIGVLYTKDGPILIWWRPSRPVYARIVSDDE
jgi:hypothetical protein